jgi:hypothetical protein
LNGLFDVERQVRVHRGQDGLIVDPLHRDHLGEVDLDLFAIRFRLSQ